MILLPMRLLADTPDPDTFNQDPRLTGIRRRNCIPIPRVSTATGRTQEANVPTSSPRLCPGCRRTIHGRCPHCTPAQRQRVDTRRGSPSSRGYDWHWRTRIRQPYLQAHPLCVLCGALANVPDHWPDTRATLIQQGVDDPDAWHRLRPLCDPCHRHHGLHGTG